MRLAVRSGLPSRCLAAHEQISQQKGTRWIYFIKRCPALDVALLARTPWIGLARDPPIDILEMTGIGFRPVAQSFQNKSLEKIPASSTIMTKS